MKTDFVKKYSHQIIAAVISFTLIISVLVMPVSAAGYANGWFTYDLNSGSLTEANENAQKNALQAAQEGIVLLKNEGSALPIVKESAKVSVFGHNSINPIYGGTGSADGSGENAVDLYEGLAHAGFETNPALQAFYNDSTVGHPRRTGGSMGVISVGFATGETPIAPYSTYTFAGTPVVDENGDPVLDAEGNPTVTPPQYANLEESYADYNDAAIIVISRSGGEGYDLPTSSYLASSGSYWNPTVSISGVVPGRTDPTEHYLELDDNEKDLIDMVSEKFEKVILVVNAANAMELGFIEENEKIDAALLVGFPGDLGFEALGQILNGEVNPSGRTVDTYVADLTKDPTYANFAANNVYGFAGSGDYAEQFVAGPAGNQYINAEGEGVGALVEYEEGIYVGYRYYETRGFVEGGTWYDDHVVYPFAYGLSYTTFEKTVEWPEDKALSKDGTIEVKVTVKNTGSVAGKETVTLFYSAPYTTGGIEKSHVNLGAFAKTDVLEPGASETLTLTLRVKDMASYDWNDANGNGIYSYEVEAGDYTLYVGDDAHVWADANAPKATFTVANGFDYAIDEDKNDNRFVDINEYVVENMTIMSRADFAGTFPVAPTVEDRTKDADFLAYLNMLSTAERNEYDKNQEYYVPEDQMPNYRKEGEVVSDPIMLIDLYGKDLDDPMWDAFLDQFTIAQYAFVVTNGNFVAGGVEEFGVPTVVTPDGSTGIVPRGGDYRGVTYASYNILAGTYNVELMEDLGESWGEEGLWTNNGGIYAPATNTHRSAFGGRNFEYFSEDGVLAGKVVAAVVKGMQNKGMLPLTKHFGLNDQETNRERLTTWFDEQAAREIYLKSFEYAVVEGGSMGIMSAYNCIGTTWAGQYSPLLNDILRGEWGFTGAVITDWGQAWMDMNMAIRNGNDYGLNGMSNLTVDTSEEAITATHVTALRNATKNVCNYVLHSNAMNSLNGNYSESVNTTLNLYVTQNAAIPWSNPDYTTIHNAVSVACPAYTMNFTNVTYTLESGNLPEGFVLNADGSFTQTEVPCDLYGIGYYVNFPANIPTGTYTFSVIALVDGQAVGQRATFTLNVIETSPEAADVFAMLNDQIDTIQLQLSKLGELTDADAELKAQLESELEALEALIATGVADTEALKAAVESANTAIDAAKAEIAELEAANGELEDRVDELEDELDELKEQLEALEEAQSAEPVEEPGFFARIWAAIVNFFKNLFG